MRTVTIIIFSWLLISLLGCQDTTSTSCPDGRCSPFSPRPTATVEEASLNGRLGKAISDLKSSLSKTATQDLELAGNASKVKESATAEVEKLFRLEYRVVEFQNGSSSELQEQLSALGKDRWDCFHVESKPNGLLLFCKRAPQSYLRYLLRMF